jgi:hypothetical protein
MGYREVVLAHRMVFDLLGFGQGAFSTMLM